MRYRSIYAPIETVFIIKAKRRSDGTIRHFETGGSDELSARFGFIERHSSEWDILSCEEGFAGFQGGGIRVTYHKHIPRNGP